MSDRRRLGDSDLWVSPIALGSWRTFERLERGAAEAVLAHALHRDVTFLDDARYDDETGGAPLPSGYSEVLFGKLLRAVGADRDALVISNKLWWEFWPGEDAVTEVSGSLERMGLERLDLLYSSTLPASVPVAVAIEQIAGVLAAGRARAWGVVNWSAEALREAIDEAARAGIPGPCAVQLPYSLARRQWVQAPAMQAALDRGGAGLVPSAVLAGGALTGKYAPGADTRARAGVGSAAGRLSGELGDPRWASALAIGAQLPALAAEMGVTAGAAALAIAFTLCEPHTASTLVGATSPDQLDQALAAVSVAEALSGEQMAALRALADRHG